MAKCMREEQNTRSISCCGRKFSLSSEAAQGGPCRHSAACSALSHRLIASSASLGAAMASTAVVATARENLPGLWAIVNQDDVEFAKGKSNKLKLHEILKVPVSAITRHRNATVSAAGLRGVFRTFPWLSRKHFDVAAHILDSRVLCKHCYLTGAAAGSIVVKTDALNAHAAAVRHLEAVEAAAERGRQLTMPEAGVKVEPPSLAAPAGAPAGAARKRKRAGGTRRTQCPCSRSAACGTTGRRLQ